MEFWRSFGVHFRWRSDQTWPLNSVPVQSAGELENDEHTAGVMMQMVRTACRFRLPGSADPCFKRMSGNTQCTGDTQVTSDWPGLTCACVSVLSDSGGFCLHGDCFRSEGVCSKTSKQPTWTNQRVTAWRWWWWRLTVFWSVSVKLMFWILCVLVYLIR